MQDVYAFITKSTFSTNRGTQGNGGALMFSCSMSNTKCKISETNHI
jgi:hypothetical protein